jgi:hypothetical protein
MAAAVAITATAAKARADINIYDKNGWGFYTRGLIAAHYQYIFGKGDPSSNRVLVGGKFNAGQSTDPRDNTLKLSRVHSGFVGTQIGFGVNRKINDQMRIESLMAVSLVDISNDRRPYTPKQVDFREAWAAVVGPAGTFKFGRMFSIFGSFSGEVVMIAHQYGVGNPCVTDGAAIACGSVGAGPIYAGFDAQFRYISPRFVGLEFQAAISDPIGGRAFRQTPQPRFDGELNYEQKLMPNMKLRLVGQGMTEELQRVNLGAQQKKRVWGVMGGGIFKWGGWTLGGGAWSGAGIGPHTVLEADTSDFGYDANGNMRKFNGVFVNTAYECKFGSKLALGTGQLNVESTTLDKGVNSGVNVLAQSKEMHVTLSQKVDALHFIVEYMNWKSTWYFGETQNVNFAGGGVNFEW